MSELSVMITFSNHDQVSSFTLYKIIESKTVTVRKGNLERQLETVPSSA